MYTIAIEEHYIADGFREAMQKSAASIFAPELQARLNDLGSLRLQEMDRGGIDFQVLSHTARMRLFPDEVALTRAANDQLSSAIARYPDRFAGFATLPMNDPRAAVQEFQRAMTLPGLKGPLIDGSSNGKFLDDPAFFPLLEQAVALNVPIYIHPGQPPEAVREIYYSGFDPAVSFSLATAGWGWHSETAIHALRLILAGVFDRLPDLQVIIGHMGEMLPFMFERINNVLAPLASNLKHPITDYFRRNFYFTTSGFFSNPPFLLALETIGIERIIYSVDYPFSTNEQGQEFLKHLPLGDNDKEKITHLNVERLLKPGKA